MVRQSFAYNKTGGKVEPVGLDALADALVETLAGNNDEVAEASWANLLAAPRALAASLPKLDSTRSSLAALVQSYSPGEQPGRYTVVGFLVGVAVASLCFAFILRVAVQAKHGDAPRDGGGEDEHSMAMLLTLPSQVTHASGDISFSAAVSDVTRDVDAVDGSVRLSTGVDGGSVNVVGRLSTLAETVATVGSLQSLPAVDTVTTHGGHKRETKDLFRGATNELTAKFLDRHLSKSSLEGSKGGQAEEMDPTLAAMLSIASASADEDDEGEAGAAAEAAT